MQYASNTALAIESSYVGHLNFCDIQDRLFNNPDRFRKDEDLADLLDEAVCLDQTLIQVFFSKGYECLETTRGENGRFLPGIMSPFTVSPDIVASSYSGSDLLLEVRGKGAELFALMHDARIWTRDADGIGYRKQIFQFERSGPMSYAARILNGATTPILIVVARACDGVISEEDFS